MESRSKSFSIWLIAVLLLLPVGYVLSVGPAVYWVSEYGSSHPKMLKTVLAFYRPLEHIHFTPAREFLDWYVHLWHE